MGSVSSREIFTTLKSKVARTFVSDSILNGSCIAKPPRCDPKRGHQRGQCGSLFFVEWFECCWCWSQCWIVPLWLVLENHANNFERNVFQSWSWLLRAVLLEIWLLQGLLDRRFGVLGGVVRLAELVLVERVQLDGFERVQLEARLANPPLR